jgi:hypothetical protein
VDWTLRLVNESTGLGGRLMAEDSTRAGAQHRCPQHAFTRWRSAERGVNRTEEALPSPRVYLRFDVIRGQAASESLSPAQRTALSLYQFVEHEMTVLEPVAPALPSA